jgi:hypothetical protein
VNTDGREQRAIWALGDRGKDTSEARLRVFVCNFCSTAEVVLWCGQNPNCGHPECTEALEKCAALHRIDDRRFHGPVGLMEVSQRLWDNYSATGALKLVS